MTVGQIIFDALAWCRYFAANESIGRPEVKLIFYEAFQDNYNMAVVSNPEYFTKSSAFTGSSFAIPTDFRHELVLLVTDAGCTSGYAKVVDNSEWDIRQSNSRLAGTTTDPLAKKDTSTFTLSGSVTTGVLYYIRNYAETQLTDETKDLSVYLPLIFHSLLLSKMQELIRVRHYRLAGTPSEMEKQATLARATAKSMKRSLKPLEIVEGLTEKPQSISAAR